MRPILTLFLASTALTAAVAIPAWSAIRNAGDGAQMPLAMHEQHETGATIWLASDDDDDAYRAWRKDDDGDDDHHRRGHDDDDDDDDDDCNGAARNPAPAGTMTPPQNGLFGDGAPPKVQMN